MNNCHPFLFLVHSFHHISQNCHLFLFLIHTFIIAHVFISLVLTKFFVQLVKYFLLSSPLFTILGHACIFFHGVYFPFTFLKYFPCLSYHYSNFCWSLVSSVWCRLSLRDERSLEADAAVLISEDFISQILLGSQQLLLPSGSGGKGQRVKGLRPHMACCRQASWKLDGKNLCAKLSFQAASSELLCKQLILHSCSLLLLTKVMISCECHIPS